MHRRFALWLGILSALLAACSLSTGTTAPGPTSTIPHLPTPSPTPDSAPSHTVESSTGPYTSVVSLLDGVCFEFLDTLNGSTWVWATPADLAAFYDWADAAEVCPGLVARGEFDFTGQVLVGGVSTSQGCDAAHQYIDLEQNDTARTQTLRLVFTVVPGCDYELVQPYLIALPAPPDGYTLQAVVTQ